jgi:pyruvate dehydrogenase E2 component (dihydrolipoamide acetyltransferase)
METGSIAAWMIQEGDTFVAGDALCTIETDKATVDFEAQDDGILAKILVLPGTDVPIGTPIGIVVEEIKDIPAFTNYMVDVTTAVSTTTTTKSPESASSNVTTTSATAAATATPSTSNNHPSLLFPSARHLAESHGKDATILLGSGKGGRVTKADVQYALQHHQLPDLNSTTKTTTIATTTAAATQATTTTTTATTSLPLPPPSPTPTMGVVDVPVPEITGQTKYEDVPNNKMRKIIASRLTASKQKVPHCYVSMEVALDDIMKFRKTLQNQHNIKISVNDCIIRASALALRDVPTVNNMYDTKTSSITTNTNIDVSVAVATPTGLITPIVFATDQLGLYEITNQVKDLATRARNGQLQPQEYQGGTFSISNLGMFGITEFSAVINPPQAAILAVGGGTPTMVPASKHTYYNEQKEDDNEVMASSTSSSSLPPYTIQNIMTARLSADRRVVDEATAALFLQVFRHYMETPELLLL